MQNDQAPNNDPAPGCRELVPQPESSPRVATDFIKMPPLQRGAEVIRFSGRSLEHWISPTGKIRTWLKLNLIVAAIIAIPVCLVMPLLNKLLAELATGSDRLAAIARDLSDVPGWLRTSVAVLAVTAVIAVIKILR
jgi:hypothetical protein